MDTKIGVISGFLGAGKTTLIRKLLREALLNEKIVLIENEFGEIGIDGTILKRDGIKVREINSGCICCTLAGDFKAALKDVLHKYRPGRVLIEPSGVGELSDILPVCREIALKERDEVTFCITVVNPLKYRLYAANFSDFFFDQIKNAGMILLSRTRGMDADLLQGVEEELRVKNPNAPILTTPWEDVGASRILEIAEKGARPLIGRGELLSAAHHHEHAETAPFESWSVETPQSYPREFLKSALCSLPQYGDVLRAKGIVATSADTWCRFDYVPDEISLEDTSPDFTGRMCVIGTELDKPGLSALFRG